MGENIKQVVLNEQTLNIKKFDFSNIPSNNVFSILGKRQSGKTNLCMDVIKNIKTKHHEIIFTHKEELTCEETLKNLINKQYTMCKNDNFHAIGTDSLVLLDDCIISKKINKSCSSFCELLLSGRRLKITAIFTMQYPVVLKPELRVNIDYIFLLAEDNIQNIKKIYNTFGGFFKTFEDFKTIFLELTKDFGAMVITSSYCNDINNKIFWYKVSDISN